MHQQKFPAVQLLVSTHVVYTVSKVTPLYTFRTSVACGLQLVHTWKTIPHCYYRNKTMPTNTTDMINKLLAGLPPFGFGLPPTLDTCKSIIKSILKAIHAKLCLCENSPRFHQIASNKRSKIKIFQGSMPPVCHMLCTWIHTCPVSTCPSLLGQKAERNLVHMICLGLRR